MYMIKSRLDMKQSGTSAPRKANRLVAILTLLFMALASIVALIITVGGANNNSNRSPATSTDIQPTSKTTEPSPATPSTSGTAITTGNSEFGTMLFNAKKQAIYIWELEESAKPECYGGCAKVWPPVLTDGEPLATGGVNNSLLGTTKRTDGSTQVTYNGHPLYYYAHEGAGEVKCHNVSTHGGLWWVIQPSGSRAN